MWLMKRFLVLILLFGLISDVMAVPGAKCDGNNLVYYDLSNNLIKRDCSILHSGSGQVFRGVCKTFEGGADCCRTEGAVTTEYRDAVRGFSYNNSNPWDEPYNPVVTSTTLVYSNVTTTTIRMCPVCVACDDCTKYIQGLFSVNTSLELCSNNLEAYRQNYTTMVPKSLHEDLLAAKGSDLKNANLKIDYESKQLLMCQDNSNTYFYVALASFTLLVFVVAVWVRYEWVGDPKVRLVFKVDKKPKI